MALNINGTTGISGGDGSVSAPALTGTDSNTGITFPAADTIKFATGGVERMSITNSGITAASFQQLSAWINYDGYGNSIRASHNIASVTDNGTGDYTFVIDTDFSDVNYCWTGTTTTATGTEQIVRVTGFSTASSSTSNNAHTVGSTRVSVAHPGTNSLLDGRQVMIQWIR